MSYSTLPDTLEILPKVLTLTKNALNTVTIDFKNSTSHDVYFTTFPEFYSILPWKCVRIDQNHRMKTMIKIPGTIEKSPLKIGLISIDGWVFPLKMKVKLIERMENAPECSVCFEHYNEDTVIPKSLPCGHTFCGNCVETLARGADQIKCPTCQRSHEVAEGVKNLPRNFDVMRLVRQSERVIEVAESAPIHYSRIPCIENTSHESKFFCFQCNCTFCDGCFESGHSTKALSNHRKVPVSFPKCHIHPDRFAEFVCTVDCCTRKPICGKCFSEEHRQHKHVTIVKRLEEVQQSIFDLMGAMRAKEQEMRELIRSERKEDIENDIIKIGVLKEIVSDLEKSIWLIDIQSLDEWFQEVTELCFKEYKNEPTPEVSLNRDEEIDIADIQKVSELVLTIDPQQNDTVNQILEKEDEISIEIETEEIDESSLIHSRDSPIPDCIIASEVLKSVDGCQVAETNEVASPEDSITELPPIPRPRTQPPGTSALKADSSESAEISAETSLETPFGRLKPLKKSTVIAPPKEENNQEEHLSFKEAREKLMRRIKENGERRGPCTNEVKVEIVAANPNIIYPTVDKTSNQETANIEDQEVSSPAT